MDPRPRTGRPWFHVGQRVWGVHLRGILTFYPDESRAPWAFNPLRFRAIVERKPTDISLFNAILEGRYALPLPEDEEEEGTWL